MRFFCYPQRVAPIHCTTGTVTESSIAGECFEHRVRLSGLRGVWIWRVAQSGQEPRAARLPAKRRQAKLIAGEMDNWAGLIDHASDWEMSSRDIEPNQQLYVYTDGSLSQLDPDRCRQVFRSGCVMKNHWRDVYEWLLAGKGGRPSRVQQNHMQERISNSCKTVHCQRLLVQGQASQFSEVQQPGGDGPNVAPDGDAVWAQVSEQMAKALANAEVRVQDIRARGTRGPVLERMQWLPCLIGSERPELIACLKRARGRARPQTGAADRARRGSDVSSDGGIGAVQ